MLLRGYNVTSGLSELGETLMREGARWRNIQQKEEQEKLTAQQNIELAQYNAERIGGANKLQDDISNSVNTGDGRYTDEDGNFSDTKYYEQWDKNITSVVDKLLTTKNARQKVEVASIEDKQRDFVIAKDHWERESARKENLIFDENVKQWGTSEYTSRGQLARVVEAQASDIKLAHEGGRVPDAATKEGYEARQAEMFRKEVASYALQNPDAWESKEGGQPTLVEEGNIDNLNGIANWLGFEGKAFSPEQEAEVKKRYETAKNDAQAQLTAERKAQAESKEIEITNDIIRSTDPNAQNRLTYEQIRNKILNASEEFISAEQPRVLTNFLDSKTNGRNENEPQALAEAYKMMTTDMTQQQKFNKLMSLSSKLESNTVDGFVKDIYKPETVSNATYKAYSSAITSLKTAKTFSGNATENINLSLKAQDLLRKFAEKNPDATEKDYAKFFNKLIENQARWWAVLPGGRPWSIFRRGKSETRLSIPANIETIQKELGTTKTGDLSSLSDEELLKRIMGK